MAIKGKKRITALQAIMPFKVLAYRFSVVILMFIALGVVFTNKISPERVEKIRTGTIDLVTPIMVVATSPVEAFHNLTEKIDNMFFIYEENKVLRQENERLLRLKTVSVELAAENKRLREVLHFIPETGVSFTTAKVVGGTGGPYSESAVIDLGRDMGVAKGQMVRNKEGVVGRILEVGSRSARIMLITDFNSRIPVITESSRERAIVAGNNSPYPDLIHIPSDTNIRVGERVITSGDGEFFPAGIPVGVVKSVGKNLIEIKTAVDMGRLEYVGIADYSKEE